MKAHQRQTLRALFAHPVNHGIRLSEAEALCHALGAEVEHHGGRLQIRLEAGPETWLHSGGHHRTTLDPEAVLRLRHFLEEAGVSPDHPETEPDSPRGDQGHRLVLQLSHQCTDAFTLDGEAVEHAVLRPHGIWGSGQSTTHRHDRDIAGQRAPLDHDYLTRITEAIAAADAVLLLGHGTGESDLRQVLLRHLKTHRRDLLERIVGVVSLDDSALGEGELLAIAREQFGNLPHRRTLKVPGQELREA
ncbi:MAG: hypothetical protein WBM08_10060 [Prochlorococcaceae cyanobacterium]